MKMRRAILALSALLLAACVSGCANGPPPGLKAQNTSFDWSQSQKKVLIVQPDVMVSELTIGGSLEPRADLTQAAQKFLASGTAQNLRQRGFTSIFLDNLTDPHEVQLVKLHSAVGNAILLHAMTEYFVLPNKHSALDWTLGPGANVLRDHYGADYAIFVYVRSSIESDSLAASGKVRGLTALASSVVPPVAVLAAIFTSALLPERKDMAFASLVDLRTGNIVWFNALGMEMGERGRMLLAAGTLGKVSEQRWAYGFINTILKDMPL